MSDVGGVVETTIKGLIKIGETTIENAEVEGLLAKTVAGVAIVAVGAAAFARYKVVTDSSAAKNVATVADAVSKSKDR